MPEHLLYRKISRRGSATNAPSSIASQDGPEDVTCDVCGARMLNLHCKLRCENCGFFRDCSDP